MLCTLTGEHKDKYCNAQLSEKKPFSFLFLETFFYLLFFERLVGLWVCQIIELLNNKLHGLSPSGGLVSPSGGFLLLLCDQGLHFASIKLDEDHLLPRQELSRHLYPDTFSP